MRSPSFSRRRALQVVGAAMFSSVAGQLLLSNRAKAAPATPGLQTFRGVSATLTGKQDLHAGLAQALYDAFARTTPGIDAALAALQATLIGNAPGDKTMFTDDQKAQSALSQAILQGWYLGTVGKGKKAECVTYIDALANRAVSAELTPPSYSYGPCGTWSAKP